MDDDAGATDSLSETQQHVLAIVRRTGILAEEDLPALADFIRRADRIPGGIDEWTLISFIQAYGRGVERIAAAEADQGARRLADVPTEELESALADWLDEVLPLARDAFDTFHAHRVEQLLRRRLDGIDSETGRGFSDTETAVALVDLRGSTAFMLERSASEIEDLVDGLYFLGAEVASRHEVSAAKFLGDGMMLVSRDRARLVAATRDAVDTLDARTALRAAGGVAHGRIIRRAGDWFGTPVNLAARLVEIAAPGEILVDAPALPGDTTVARWRTVALRGLPEPRHVAVV